MGMFKLTLGKMKRLIVITIVSLAGIFLLLTIVFGQKEKQFVSAGQLKTVEKRELAVLTTANYAISKQKEIVVVEGQSRYGKKIIYIISPDGAKKKLIELMGHVFRLKFSPYSNKIAFAVAANVDAVSRIIIYDLDSGRSTTIQDSYRDCAWLDFAPDNKRIVYGIRLTPKKDDLVISDFEGKAKEVIGQGHFPKWSPAGNKIAFSRGEFDGRRYLGSYIWIYDLQNNTKKKLTNSKKIGSGNMRWSPSGKEISAHNGYNVGIINIDMDTRVDIGEIEAHSPAWSPDGSKLAFCQPYLTGHEGVIIDEEIFVVNADGSGLTNLTNTPDIWEKNPVWIAENEIIVEYKENGISKLYVLKLNQN